MSIEEKFRIEVDLRPGGKNEVFTSLENFEKWVNKEIAFWDWGQEWRSGDRHAFNTFHNASKVRLDSLGSFVSSLKRSIANGNESEFQRLSDNLKHQLARHYSNSELLHSSTPIAKYIAKVSESDKAHAAYIYQSATEAKQPQDWGVWKGKIAHMLFDWNIKNKAKSEEAALKDLENQFAENLNESKERLESLVKTHEENKDKHDEQLLNQEEKSQALLKNKEEELDQFIKETEKKFSDIEEIYEKRLALHSAISYWEKKASYHKGKADTLKKVVGATFVVVALSIFAFLSNFMGDDTLETVKLWKLGLLGVGATIGVWALRLVVRLLLSNLHLENDARERRTMLMTYLAMRREKDLPEDDKSRNLILQALFRPTSAGIVKDDATPPFMAEWLKSTTGHD